MCFFNEYIFYANLGDLTSCLSVFGLGSDPSKVKINLNCGYGYEVVLTNGYGYFSNVTVTSKHGQGGFWIKNGASLEVKDCRMVSLYDNLLVVFVYIATYSSVIITRSWLETTPIIILTVHKARIVGRKTLNT